MEMAKALAAQGKAYLDGYLGEDWQQYLDLDELDMADSERCLLAQLVARHPNLTDDGNGSKYVQALLALGKDDDWAVLHGFEAAGSCSSPSGSVYCTCGPQYKELNQAWRAVLAA